MIRSVQSELDRQNFLIKGGVETCRSLGKVGDFADAREWMQTLPLPMKTSCTTSFTQGSGQVAAQRTIREGPNVDSRRIPDIPAGIPKIRCPWTHAN